MNEEIEKINKENEFELKTQSLTKNLYLNGVQNMVYWALLMKKQIKFYLNLNFPYEYGAIDRPMNMIEEINKKWVL